jgi:DNA-binding response OmpR family regulator
MLTALGETEDRILGLDSGADDYMIKPFEMAELLARVRALLRRPAEQFVTALSVRGLVLEPTTRIVRVDGETVTLTVKEFVVLEYLMRHAGTVVSREQLLEHCWDFAYSAFSNITDVYIKQLRQKLHDTDQQRIKTIRGVGYLLAE